MRLYFFLYLGEIVFFCTLGEIVFFCTLGEIVFFFVLQVRSYFFCTLGELVSSVESSFADDAFFSMNAVSWMLGREP